MQDWTTTKSLEKAKQEVDALNIPSFSMDLSERDDLEFSNLMNVENKQLETYLTMYGGYKAYIETELADQEAVMGALEASFVEEYSISHFKIAKIYEDLSMRKPTKEELRGEVLTKFPDILVAKQKIIDAQVKLKKISGLLNSNTTAYNTVSRVVALRTYRPSV
tara:strand:+ start:154 stop:645 length:492 start_codon:yes stop_codon:yes gene_type:complete